MPEHVSVAPGGSFDLRVHAVIKQIGDRTFPMLAYNGTIPGPTLRVQQGSQIAVHVTNDTPMETTVHWHGLRLENPYDGVPHDTQSPIPPSGTYTHHLVFPDAGVFWYHPHMREDYAQEMGLYGNIIVEPADAAYWPDVDREFVLTLDDILIEDGSIAAFDPHQPNFAAMGRFGNVLLIGGETRQQLELDRGEVARLYLTNTANTRVFKVGLPGARVKLVGSDSGRYEHEQWVEDVIIAPSERAVVDVRCDEPGTFTLQHVTPEHTHQLAQVTVRDRSSAGSGRVAFDTLRVNAEMVAERRRVRPYLDAQPDKTLALVAQMQMQMDHGAHDMHDMHAMHDMGSGEQQGMDDGIEWEDAMPDMNRMTTAADIWWNIVDRATGKVNGDIAWSFEAGDQVKIRLVNEMASDHPMHHPFHVHGERFLVLARDGVENPNLVWKDTVLVRTGETVDILMDASNPGVWMAHCHIPEHMGSGMMFRFRVRPPAAHR